MKDYNYSVQAKYYDILERNFNVLKFNKILDKILLKYKVKSVLDLTCGTGYQSIYLHKKGYKVVASDLSKEMIEEAQKKYSKIRFNQADIRSAYFGKFDSVISIFNAVGHLSKKDFSKAIKNISKNLKKNGIYIFDIFNLDYMNDNFKNYEFIDKCTRKDDLMFVRFNNNKLDKKLGIMNINQKTYIQKGISRPEIYKESWDMQIYSTDQLKKIFKKNGFEILEFLDMGGGEFNKERSLFILTIARKL